MNCCASIAYGGTANTSGDPMTALSPNSNTQNAKADALAEKIAKKAADTLSRLQIEMEVMKWAPEFRAIMWNAVAHHATILATEAEQQAQGKSP